ncbi:glycosyltransferase family 4 protein [Aridibaculum aurantiacum]|uniref:glycosyltransferase family 4 protein n=1 Tax=Aridibaculum aurantiacum TaxID=2810307 RepID=UPI001A9644F3|nr:glycosyltransferase family 4 protein [Aridibaculum aurantiacum]
MKVVLVYDQLNTGGTERLIVTIANLLHDHGHEVKVIILKEPSALDTALNFAIPVVYLHRKNKYSIFKMKYLAAACQKADIIHLHSYYNWRYFYLTSVLFRVGDARIILHEHSDMKQMKGFDKALLSNLDAFIAVHPIQANEAEQADVPKKKVHLLPNIVTSNYKLLPQFEKKNRILMVGNIRREKYYELAIEIIKKLPASIALDIYGNVNDPLYQQELEGAISNYGLQDRVHFITGETEVYQHFAKYDLALHTANNETGPLVVLEYLAVHMPFFCSSAGQSPALMAPIIPQVVMSSYNAQAWADKINGYYSLSKEEHHAFVRQIETAAKRLLNAEDYYQSLLNIYEQA